MIRITKKKLCKNLNNKYIVYSKRECLLFMSRYSYFSFLSRLLRSYYVICIKIANSKFFMLFIMFSCKEDQNIVSFANFVCFSKTSFISKQNMRFITYTIKHKK